MLPCCRTYGDRDNTLQALADPVFGLTSMLVAMLGVLVGTVVTVRHTGTDWIAEDDVAV